MTPKYSKMEDYIFLIIAVVISIFAAIKKNKNKINDDQPIGEKAERPRNFFMDQLLGVDFLDESVAEDKPPVRVKPVLKKEVVVSTIPLGSSTIHHTQFKSSLPDRPKKNLQSTIRKPIAEELETEDIPGYLEDFSLRKAFVYSEILGQKYNLDTKFE